ncbi:hypothetical protein MKZ17_17310 [Solibacillus sp. FSL R7-0682]|uniref:hypothetical protein n=1 Tax=Solibacillus sp. FSL R7-0682 TaxID=2921690 RepID=UPI0030FC613A
MNKYKGYHGTNEKCATSIEVDGFKIKSYSFNKAQLEQVPGDLGAGAYFYHDSIDNAFNFALKENKKAESIRVLECEIEVDESKILDLNDKKNSDVFNQIMKNDKALNTLKRRYFSGIGGKSRDCLDGVIIENLIHKSGQDVHLVIKDTYTPFKEMPRLSNFFNGTELCVKNKGIIKTINII